MRFPAEWERHERTLMGWPCRAELWGPTLAQAREDYAAVANAIAAFEPVTMIANPGADAVAARAACSASVQVVELGLDDSWLRDCGPIYTVEDGSDIARADAGAPAGDLTPAHTSAPPRRLAVHFGFNAWGEKFFGWEQDAAVGGLIAHRLGDEVRDATHFVLEGGSVISDGAGTVITTEQCLLNKNRNPRMGRQEIEAELRDYLGAGRVLWLGKGLVEDRDTDGHIDLIAAVLPDRRVMLQVVEESNPNFEHCEENRRRLTAAEIEVVPMPYLPYTEVEGEQVAVSYMNLYICNDAVIVPVCGSETDADALALIGAGFPGREVVTVPGAVIAYGGGGPHCITQQVPAISAEATGCAAPHTADNADHERGRQ